MGGSSMPGSALGFGNRSKHGDRLPRYRLTRYFASDHDLGDHQSLEAIGPWVRGRRDVSTCRARPGQTTPAPAYAGRKGHEVLGRSGLANRLHHRSSLPAIPAAGTEPAVAITPARSGWGAASTLDPTISAVGSRGRGSRRGSVWRSRRDGRRVSLANHHRPSMPTGPVTSTAPGDVHHLGGNRTGPGHWRAVRRRTGRAWPGVSTTAPPGQPATRAMGCLANPVDPEVFERSTIPRR